MSEIALRDGVWVGPERRPLNPAEHGSIHDTDVAQKLGFRGGTIAGSIHMEQFVPLLCAAIGPAWLETGSLSLYFLYATLHDEPVRCFAGSPPVGTPNPQVTTWMESPDGRRICEGTASLGSPDEPSELERRLQRVRPPRELRILEGLEPGDPLPPRPARISAEALEERLKVTIEPMPDYGAGSRWGAPALPPTLVVQALRRCESGMDLRHRGQSIGLFGAIEIGFQRGPVLCEQDYVASGEVVAVGDSPKTEYFWYRSRLDDADSGDRVAHMTMLLRFMKGSSPLWQEQAST